MTRPPSLPEAVAALSAETRRELYADLTERETWTAPALHRRLARAEFAIPLDQFEWVARRIARHARGRALEASQRLRKDEVPVELLFDARGVYLGDAVDASSLDAETRRAAVFRVPALRRTWEETAIALVHDELCRAFRADIQARFEAVQRRTRDLAPRRLLPGQVSGDLRSIAEVDR